MAADAECLETYEQCPMAISSCRLDLASVYTMVQLMHCNVAMLDLVISSFIETRPLVPKMMTRGHMTYTVGPASWPASMLLCGLKSQTFPVQLSHDTSM